MTKPAITKEGGQCVGGPDVCFVPAPPPPTGPGGIPTPFPNKGSCSSTDKATKKVKFNKKGVAVQNSKIPSSMGDEAGVGKQPPGPGERGVKSRKNRAEIKYKSHSSKVKAENKGIVPLLATTSHNKDNMPAGKVVAPSQVKILIN